MPPSEGGGDEGLKVEGGFPFGRLRKLQGGFKRLEGGLKGLHLRKALRGLKGTSRELQGGSPSEGFKGA